MFLCKKCKEEEEDKIARVIRCNTSLSMQISPLLLPEKLGVLSPSIEEFFEGEDVSLEPEDVDRQ